MHRRWKLIVASLAAISAPMAAADGHDPGATAWIMTTTALVLFMTIPGLSLFYAGLVRAKNVLSILMQCFSITCLVTILWLLLGYSLAFSDGNFFIGGLSKAFFYGVTEDSMSGSIPESSFSTFQLTFAIITVALIVGGFAERIRFSAVMLFTAAWSLLVYAPITHWIWSEGGWLFERGFLDFAGGAVVHIPAGVAAIVAALVIGQREGFTTQQIIPHNVPLTVAGAGMLWVGWFGFNGGSALAADGNAAMAITVTHIAAATAAFTWMCVEWIRFGKPSAVGAVTGMVAGLGTITPASGFVGPGGAFLIGIAAGIVCFFATHLLKNALKIDDSLDVFPVHGIGGIIGTIGTGVLASSALGLFAGQEEINIGSQLLTQTIGVVAVIAYTAVLTWVILKVIDLIVGLRVPLDHEIDGLDLESHNEQAYNQ